MLFYLLIYGKRWSKENNNKNYPNSYLCSGEIKFIPKELKNDVMHDVSFRAEEIKTRENTLFIGVWLCLLQYCMK
jgi:hypothetical protein